MRFAGYFSWTGIILHFLILSVFVAALYLLLRLIGKITGVSNSAISLVTGLVQFLLLAFYVSNWLTFRFIQAQLNIDLVLLHINQIGPLASAAGLSIPQLVLGAVLMCVFCMALCFWLFRSAKYEKRSTGAPIPLNWAGIPLQLPTKRCAVSIEQLGSRVLDGEVAGKRVKYWINQDKRKGEWLSFPDESAEIMKPITSDYDRALVEKLRHALSNLSLLRNLRLMHTGLLNRCPCRKALTAKLTSQKQVCTSKAQKGIQKYPNKNKPMARKQIDQIRLI
ncbi:MAG: hypothetical protein HKN25_01730 [Pyrinomonadaceae bacterium]|nr:hypothetical protein [Pyrinomonadaceae bacterium]